jgi:hypothetical protein
MEVSVVPGTDQAALRPREEIQAVRARLQDEHQRRRLPRQNTADPYDTNTLGQIAALTWVSGEAEEAPLTGQVGVDVSDQWAITREQIHATEMLQGRAPQDRRGRHYISGVEHALMWVLYESVTPM